MNNKINLYFDMDGVLAKYDRHAYEERIGQGPMYKQLGGHYFRNVAPDDRALDLLETALKYPGEFEVNIITTLTNLGGVFMEQHADKLQWLAENVKSHVFRDGIDFIPVIGSKRRIASWLKRDILDYQDILIDDYNPNLEDWWEHGGLAVKYLNGINSPSFSGPMITTDMSSEDILEMLRILSRANHENR